MLSTLTRCCYRDACTKSSALVVFVVELRATACCCFLCGDGLMLAQKMLRLRSSSQMREVNTDGAARGGVWLRSSVCVRAIGIRSYCPVHPFIVVIKVRTVQHTRCCVRNRCFLPLTGVSHLAPRTESTNLCSLLDVGGREATLML